MASLTWHMLEETLHNTSVFKLHLLINLDILPFMKDKNSAQKLPPYHPASSPDELQCACFVAFAFGVSSEKPLCFPRNPFFVHKECVFKENKNKPCRARLRVERRPRSQAIGSIPGRGTGRGGARPPAGGVREPAIVTHH